MEKKLVLIEAMIAGLSTVAQPFSDFYMFNFNPRKVKKKWNDMLTLYSIGIDKLILKPIYYYNCWNNQGQVWRTEQYCKIYGTLDAF